MLTTSELKSYAHMRRLKHTDHIWKDYLQDVVLYYLYRRVPRLVFRGGTCIWKLMRGDRFSEDLDLCTDMLPNKFDAYLRKELELCGFVCRILKRKQTFNMLFLKLGIVSPAHPREITFSVEILVSKKCAERIETTTLYSPYPDIPPIEVCVPSREEIVADKISAIFQRNKPRDIHDLYVLLKQGASIDHELTARKAPGFTLQKFKEKLMDKQGSWKTLEPLVVTRLPPLTEEIKYIISVFESTKTSRGACAAKLPNTKKAY